MWLDASTRSSTTNGELQHLLTLEGLPREIMLQILDTAESVRRRHRARSEEGAAAARQGGVQPVLRALDAHAHDVRDRGQAPVGRRDQPRTSASRRTTKGEIAARHRRQPRRRCTPTCSSCATRSRARRTSSRSTSSRTSPRDQRRRRPPRASRRRACSTCSRSATTRRISRSLRGGDRRRRAAFARRALADPRAHHARRARRCASSGRRRCCRPTSRRSACASSTTCARACADCDVVMMLRLQNERMQRRAAAFGAGVLQALRPDRGQARARQARRDRDASRAR